MRKIIKYFLDDKQIAKNKLNISNLDKLVKRLKSFCFLSGMTVASNYTLNNGQKLTIKVISKGELKP